jgi:uncharacterized membrane protein YtjA (UPF0391 family)
MAASAVVSVAHRHEAHEKPDRPVLFAAWNAPNSAEARALFHRKPFPGSWHERCNALHHTHVHTEDCVMLYWAAVFFVIALLAAIFGFGGIAASAAGVAKVLFFVFLVFALVSFLFGRRTAA